MKLILPLVICLLLAACSKSGNTEVEYTATAAVPAQTFGIDSVLAQDTADAFNGVILISRDGQTVFTRSSGYADLESNTPMKFDDQFVIGSLSKQITAVIILREYERGHLNLQDPIGKYLPEFTRVWKDSITIHHLLTHTHGITNLNSRRAFEPGTQFAYSNFGYKLLGDIAERASGKSLGELATELFTSCGMHNSTFRGLPGAYPVKSYSERLHDSLVVQDVSKKFTIAAGGFISTAEDLVKWNNCLHGGKILADSTYRLMIGKYITRKHRVFGDLDYGYGISTSKGDSLTEISHSGYAEGFVSINYYFPESRTSLIVLENIARGPGFDEVYGHHLQILRTVRKHLMRDRPVHYTLHEQSFLP
jgi:D-alanyl-D-alanine carboxypeptidase